MSTRSTAWYAVPANAARRKRRMRAYQGALTELGQRYAGDRRAAYQEGLAAGKTPSAASSAAAHQIRRAHPAEFAALYREHCRLRHD